MWTREASLVIISDNLRQIQNARVAQAGKQSDYKRAISGMERERNRLLANRTLEESHDDMWVKLKG